MKISFKKEKKLNGIRYCLVSEDKIKDYVVEIANKEWSGDDFLKYGDDLYKSEWSLEVIEVRKIKPNYEMLKTEKFQKDLLPRIKEQQKLNSQDKPIPPLILRGSDLLIFDGYARYHVFKERKVEKCLAYVGH